VEDSSNETQNKVERDGPSIYIAILVAGGVAAVLVAFTFTLFVRSSTYGIVENIQANEQVKNDGLEGYDTTSPVKTVDIDETLKGIENTVNKLDTDSDYGPQDVTSEALGLPF
jgi:flagellar basal body-associated protein FliL